MRRAAKVFLFLPALALLLIGLKVLNWFPTQLNENVAQRYPSMGHATRALHIEPLPDPHFFPHDLAWPATEVIAGRVPQTVVLAHFEVRDGKRVGLSVQRFDGPSAPLPVRNAPSQTLSERSVDVGAYPGTMRLGLCADRLPCNQVEWHTDAWGFLVTGTLPEATLMRLARGLHGLRR